MAMGKARIEHGPEPFPGRSVQAYYVVTAEQFSRIKCDLGALVEGLPRCDPLGHDFRIRDVEPSGPKGPQVDIKEVAEVVLFLDVTAPRMGVSLGGEMLMAVGCDRKVPSRNDARGGDGFNTRQRNIFWQNKRNLWSRTSCLISCRTLHNRLTRKRTDATTTEKTTDRMALISAVLER
jgi:hypothetical protein